MRRGEEGFIFLRHYRLTLCSLVVGNGPSLGWGQGHKFVAESVSGTPRQHRTCSMKRKEITKGVVQ